MSTSGYSVLSLLFCIAAIGSLSAQPDHPRQRHYWDEIRPILAKHCYHCHNGEDNKAGINLERYDFIISIVRDGELFHNIMEVMQARTMPPPDTRPPMSQAEIDTFVTYIDIYLQEALAEKDPGIISPRRLNNQEYGYAMKDLLNVDLDVDSIFPADPSGGGGFDNQARTLYLTPLLMERYYETAEYALEERFRDSIGWRQFVPAFRLSMRDRLKNWWYRAWYDQDISDRPVIRAAEEILIPFATLAYRRFLDPEEKKKLTDFFLEVYHASDPETRFDTGIKETLKIVLISHHFLYRQEADPDLPGSYPVNGFELASRLSFFLWSSLPDLQLLNTAYREDLHQPTIMAREVRRMLRSPKAKRLGEQFAVQWLDIKKLKDPAFQLDAEIFPEYTPALRDLMLREIESFFSHVFLESRNLLELLDSDYSFLNQDLAQHYGIPDVQGQEWRKVNFASEARGGILGMAGVLTATSLPTRTSPVLRGKWVLEQVLGTPAPPPPPNVPELEESHDPSQGPQTLRAMLLKHQADPACSGCHKTMDPIGLGLENFDALGRWRTAYGTEAIDASGILKTGEVFNGPAELRTILRNKKELFAKNFSKKMLSYALGRSLGFKDTPTIEKLQQNLLENDFNSIHFIRELVMSFPFRYKKSDNEDVGA